MKDLVDINYLLSKVLTKIFGYFIRFVLILNKKNIEIHKFKDSYDKLYSTFFSKLDDNNSEIIIKESCPICEFRGKLYKFNIYKFPIVQCKRCLFIYREKTISQFILGRWRTECVDFYYKEKGQKNELTEKLYQDLLNNRATKLKMIFKKMNFSPQGKNFLDIGCGIGTTCAAANLLGMNAFGIDIDPGRGRNIDTLERHKSYFAFIKGDFE